MNLRVQGATANVPREPCSEVGNSPSLMHEINLFVVGSVLQSNLQYARRNREFYQYAYAAAQAHRGAMQSVPSACVYLESH